MHPTHARARSHPHTLTCTHSPHTLTPSHPHTLAEDHSEVHEQQVYQLRNNQDGALEENRKWGPRL